MVIEKSIISEKLKKLRSLASVKVGEAQGVLISEGKIKARDHIMSVEMKLPEAGDETFVLPVKAMDYICSLPESKVEITEATGRVKVKSSVGSATFSTAHSDEFISGVTYGSVNDMVATISCDGEQFFESVSKVVYVCTEKSSKPVSAGVLFDNDGEKLNIVTCDGVRAAHTALPLPGERYHMIVPAAILKFAKSLGSVKEIAVYRDGKFAVIRSEEYIIRANLISGEFIDYKKIFKGKGTTPSVKVDRFIDTMQRCAIIANSNATTSPAVFEFSENTISVNVSTSTDEFSETVDCDTFAEPLTIGCNPRYIIDALKNCCSDKVTITAASPKHPIFICDGSAEMLVLPVMLKNGESEEKNCGN